jgi:hypothetical protein
MNVIQINPKTSQLKLNSFQQQKCGNECIAYINPYAIGITTCGTYIDADFVLAQKHSEKVSFFEDTKTGDVRLETELDGQKILACSTKAALQTQNLLSFCKKQKLVIDTTDHTKLSKVYSDCEHIKLILNSKDVTFGLYKNK